MNYNFFQSNTHAYFQYVAELANDEIPALLANRSNFVDGELEYDANY